MIEKEITVQLNISDEDLNLIDLHSVYNTLNVLKTAIKDLATFSNKQEQLQALLLLIQEFSLNLRDSGKSVTVIKQIDEFINKVTMAASNFVEVHGLQSNETATNSLQNVISITGILSLLGAELKERMENMSEWAEFPKELLEFNFYAFFSAVAKNSKGKYKIIYNIAVREEDSYMLSFHIDTIYGNKVYMPIMFQDIMRDLVANARKYSPVGGMIFAGLSETEEYIRFAVEDYGAGIPDDEIDKVVEYKYRASNIREKNTNGGGFGLTKAYLLTKKFGGRMWIKSEVNVGTRIIIQIPKVK